MQRKFSLNRILLKYRPAISDTLPIDCHWPLKVALSSKLFLEPISKNRRQIDFKSADDIAGALFINEVPVD
jgi:hypothetical protein